MRTAWFHTSLSTLVCALSLMGCGDDENGGSEGGGGQDAAAGGSLSTGGSPTTGGTSNGGGGAGGTANGGGGTGGANGGADAGYTAPVPSLPAPVAYIAGGNFVPLGSYSDGSYSDIVGHAQIIRTADGNTTVQLHVEGLIADKVYPAHVHALPCDVDNGGSHYKIDPGNTDADQTTNEIWPEFTTDADGVGRASVDVAHAALPDAQSIVIHDPDAANAKLACVDLLPEPLATTTSSGDFVPFAAATADEQNVGGTATLVRSAAGTDVTLAVTGLDPAGTYAAHVHALPCAVTDADGHYKIDPTNTATDEANEIWPVFGDGGMASVTTSHIARPDAQSVVIHRTDLGVTPAPKVACADLVREEPYGDYVTEGTASELPGATTKGVAGLTGSGTMTRSMTTTEATVTVGSLLASTAYTIHVHNHTCAFTNPGPGGGHYMVDTAGASDATNEFWLNLTTDGTGAGTQTVSKTHLARPEAGSIVVHDAGDGTRLACIDLL
jgi:hypothetical protein